MGSDNYCSLVLWPYVYIRSFRFASFEIIAVPYWFSLTEELPRLGCQDSLWMLMKYSSVISVIHVALKKLRAGVFCGSKMERIVLQCLCDRAVDFMLYWQGKLMRFHSSCSGYVSLQWSPEKGRESQVLTWNFCHLTMLLFLYSAKKKFFFYPISNICRKTLYSYLPCCWICLLEWIH